MNVLPGPALTVRHWLLASAIALSLAGVPATHAQQIDHSKMDHSKMHMPAPVAPKKKPARKKKAATRPARAKVSVPAEPVKPSVHATMDHAAMGHSTSVIAAPMDHAAAGHSPPATAEPGDPIPVLTDADREAAFPAVQRHRAHDLTTHSFWLIDRLETWDADEGSAFAWQASGWVGGDIHRLWLRTEGEVESGNTESADVEVLYGRSISPWWDMVAGVRHEIGEGPSQSFAALGLMGLSPYKFELEATAYLGQSGQTALRLEAEYDTLLSNRLILQWQAELALYGRNDPLRSLGSGLSTAEAGLRLRYEVTRRFAPYVGVVWERAYGQTADYRRSHLHDASDRRVVAGFRFWF